MEARTLLNAHPIAAPDPSYHTDVDAALTVTTSDTTLLDNDWDPEGSSLTASVVDNPTNGTLSNFTGSDGTFTYTPDTSFEGLDSFTYKVSDGTDDSSVVTVSIAVGGDFGPRTNQEEVPLVDNYLTGHVLLTQELTPGVELIYNSGTHPEPIVVLETFLQDDESVPDAIKAKLTFDGSAGTDYAYVTTGLAAGDTLRFALQHDATSLPTGRYDYTVRLTSEHTSGNNTRDYSGDQMIVNRSGSTHPFGRGWQLSGLDQLHAETGGMMLERSDGTALWFADDGSGGYDPAAGDLSFSTLVKNGDNTFTLTDKHGIEQDFDTSGYLTSIEDRNGNTTTFTYTSNLLTKITDPFSRDTTFTYTSGQLTSISDFASRSATLTYDASGRLDKITQPDPDGAGALAAPEWEFAYDATSHQLITVTNALDDDTDYTYGSHNRLTKITFPDTNDVEWTSLQTIGLPTGSTGNSLTAADPEGTRHDELNNDWKFRTDRFGHLTEWEDPLGNETVTERRTDGLAVKITEEDPDGTGSKYTNPVTILGHDDDGNLVYQQNPDATTRTWTYTATFNLVDVVTDEVGRQTDHDYDTNGNLTKITDGGGFETTFTYNTSGLVTKMTAPDPDGAGPLAAAETEYAYDANGRLTTLTNPDDTTRTFTYDTANNRLTEKDELNNTTTFTYDNLNRRTKITDREGGEFEFAYNAMGLVTKETDALDEETDYTYNSRGWVTKIEKPDPDDTGPLGRPTTNFVYDAAGNLTSHEATAYENEAVTNGYDAAGRLTSVEQDATTLLAYTYDNLGRQTKVTDAVGVFTTFEYDSRGRVTQERLHEFEETEPNGPETLYSYTDAGELQSVLDPRGYQTSYVYNDRGLLESEWLPDPDGTGPLFRPVTHYTYDNAGRLTEVEDTLGRKTTYEYNSRDLLTKSTLPDPDGAGALAAPVLTFAFDSVGRRTSVTDPLSRVTTTAFDKEGRTTSITYPDPDDTGPLASPVVSFVYDAAGNLTSETDALSNTTSYEYDNVGRRTKMTEPDPDGAGSQTSPVTTYAYSGQGLSKITDPLGRETTFQYDSVGRRTGITDDSSNKTSFEYDDLDNVTKITAPDPDGAGPLAAPVVSFAYDEFNRLSSFTNPESGVTRFTYDLANNLLSLQDAELNDTTWSYDGLGRVTIETNELSKSRSFVYDSAGNLTRRTDRESRVIQKIHDDLDRMTQEQWLTGATPAPSIALATTTEGGPPNEVQRVGHSSTVEPMGGTFTLSFDGSTTSDIDFDADAATVQSELESLSSIGTGNVAVTKSQDGPETHEWTLTFQGTLGGTNVAQTTVDSSNIEYEEDPPTDIEATDTQGGGTPNDEVQTVTVSNADDGTFRLAFEGYTTAPLDHDATAATIDSKLEELNSIDTVTVTGNAGGPWTITFTGTHAGDNVEQLGGDTSNLIKGTLGNTIDVTFDATSQITAISDDDSGYDYTYDDLGRLLTVDNADTPGVPNVILTSVYDANGNRTSLAAEIDSTDDFLNSYTYDNLNRLTRVDQDSQTGGNTVHEKRVDFSYNAVGLFTKIERFNDLDGNSGDEIATSHFTYDSLGRLTDLAYKNGGTNLFTPYEWSYDSLSVSLGDLNVGASDPRILALVQYSLPVGLGRVTQFVGADGTTDYDYDKTSQLTSADHTYQTDETYTYDDTGNRTMTGYTTGSNNRLTNDGTYSYTYDDEGNRTKRTHDTTGDETHYDWDHRNRLIKVTEKDDLGTTTKVVEYDYDVFNRRIEKAVDTTSPFNLADAAIERYVYDDVNGIASDDGGNVVLDFVDPDGDGTGSTIDLERRYLYGNAVDQILAQEDDTLSTTSADRVFWPLVDNLGTVRDLVKNDATMGEHFKFDAFGNVTAGDTSVTRYLYTSREFDEETGLQYNRARWYDASVGRWLSEDPLEFEAGHGNTSSYLANSPSNGGDPSGLKGPIDMVYELLFMREEIARGRRLTEQQRELALRQIGQSSDPFAHADRFRELTLNKQAVDEAAGDVEALIKTYGEVAAATAGASQIPTGLTQSAKRRLAKEMGDIARSTQPTAQGRYRQGTKWWEYKDVHGNRKIVIEHPDGTVHVGRPKPQSEHLDGGGPPKYYPEPGTGHVGE